MQGAGSGQFGLMKNSSKSVVQKELALEMRTWVGKQAMNYSQHLQAKDNNDKNEN